MLINDILEEQPEAFPTVTTDASVSTAARLMRERDVRAVPVVENDRLIGIVTDWDIVHAFSKRAGDLADMPVSSIMTSDGLITIKRNATATDATAVLAEHRVHHLPVLDGDRYCGTICLGLEWSEEGMLTPPVRPTLTARRP